MDNELKSLARVLEQQIVEADQRSSEVGTQRERNHRYYSMQPIGNEMPGRSRYIDPSVMDVVESKKAFFRETFLSSRKAVKFLPGDGETQQQADAKTAYVERQLKENEWPQVFRDCLHDAFVSKRCVLHVEWLEDTDTTMLSAAQASPEHVTWQMRQTAGLIDADLSAVQQNPDGTLTGMIRLITDSSKVCIKLVQPERYYRDPHSTYPSDAAFITYEEDVTRAGLIEQGYDPEQIEDLGQDYRFRRDEEDNARKSHDGSWTRARMYSRPEEIEQITTYWTYAWINLSEHMDGAPEETRLYKIRWAKSQVLMLAPDDEGNQAYAIEEVSEMPFLEWTQYKVSHAESGMCDADVIAPLQKQLSTFKRLIIDNQQMGNTSRWQVKTGALKSMRSLLDTSIGGVVETRDMEGIRPLPPPPLSPAALPSVEMLETDKEARSGNTRLSKGMNKDAMSEQNAASMIERLTTSGNKRTASEARDFASTLLVPLMRQIYRIGVRNDKRAYQLEVAGQQAQASPQQWSEPAPHAEVAVALTPEEGVKQAMSMMQMHQVMSKDPGLQVLYGIQQKHAMVDEIFDLLGVADASRFMMTPGSDEFNQQMKQQQEQQQQQQQMQMQQMQMQAQLMQSADKREWAKYQTDAQKSQIDIMDTASDNDRADEELDHKKVIDFMKVGIERRAANAKPNA